VSSLNPSLEVEIWNKVKKVTRYPKDTLVKLLKEERTQALINHLLKEVKDDYMRFMKKSVILR
jgi:hypothetical protein